MESIKSDRMKVNFVKIMCTPNVESINNEMSSIFTVKHFKCEIHPVKGEIIMTVVGFLNI